VIKNLRMRWAKYEVRRRKMRNAYNILVRKPQRKRPHHPDDYMSWLVSYCPLNLISQDDPVSCAEGISRKYRVSIYFLLVRGV
jgi:hypothetical protein